MLHWFAKRLKEVREKDKEVGFTLIELLVVVIIIGILAAIAIPVFLNQRAGAQDAAAKSNVRIAAQAEQAYAVQNGSYSTVAADLRPFGFNQGTPAVTLQTGTATDFCVTATSASGTLYSQREDQGQPVTGGCP